ncbi:MAG: DNA polymerase III subunit delta [Calditrichaeota bacterium]|nr:MAG: DNA polymerase III subunit delta [Calditrichota bacterium]
MNYREFQRHLAKKELATAYLLSGAERYLVEECLNALLDVVVDPATRDFNLDVFYGGETDAGKIIEAANAYPMLSDVRAVVVKDVQKLSQPHLEYLAKYLQNPSPTTRLVLINTKGGALGKGLSKLKSRAVFVELKPLYDSQVPAWVQAHLKKFGIEISQKACLALQARVGNELGVLANELEKIMLNLDGRTRIEEDDVHKLVGLSRSYSIFNLNDAVGSRDLATSLRILNRMLESGESPTGILAMFTRHFVNLAKVKAAMAGGKSAEEISALTGIPGYFVQKTKTMAAKFSAEQLQQIFESLLAADLALKTSSQPPEIALQTLLVRIMR